MFPCQKQQEGLQFLQTMRACLLLVWISANKAKVELEFSMPSCFLCHLLRALQRLGKARLCLRDSS